MGRPQPVRSRAVQNEALLDEAIDWLLRVRDDTGGQAQDECLRWRAAHPDHERAWQGVSAVGSRLRSDTAGVAPAVVTQVLHQAGKPGDRRVVLKSLALGGTLLLGGGAAWRHVSQQQGWNAQYRTGVGERSDIVLADGARVWLNTDTALDVVNAQDGRLLVLRRGEILVQTAQGEARQPLRVQTPAGMLRPMGTRFNVQLLPDRGQVFLAVQEGAVDVALAAPVAQDAGQADRPAGTAEAAMAEPTARAGDASERMPQDALPAGHHLVAAGQQCRFDAAGILQTAPIVGDPSAWRAGMLAASRMPLDQFLAQLARHRPGIIQCDPDIAGLLVTGAFPLDDTDRVLHTLETALPVQVSMFSRYWVRVRPQKL